MRIVAILAPSWRSGRRSTAQALPRRVAVGTTEGNVVMDVRTELGRGVAGRTMEEQGR